MFVKNAETIMRSHWEDVYKRQDETIVTYSFVLGKYQTKLPGVGQFFRFFKTTPGYIVCRCV